MAWSRVQSKSGSSAAATTTVTLTSTPTTGNKIIAAVTVSNQPSVITSVKDGNGNSLTQIANVNGTDNGNVDVALYAYDVPATPSAAITVTISAGVDNAMLVQEVSGLLAGNTTAMCDGTAATSHGGTTTYSNPTYSSTATNEFLVSVYGDNGGPTTYAAANSYTTDVNGINTNSSNDIVIAYKNSTNGSEAAGVSLSGTAAGWGAVLVAFKLAAGGGPAFVAGEAMVVGQGSTPDASVGLANSPSISQAVRRAGYY